MAGIGFGHTSTTSLAAALRRLGLRTKHWAPQFTLKLMCLKLSGGAMPEPGIRLHENATEEEAVKNFEWGWDALSETDAILDEPVNLFWKHIYRRFPDTLFVLTKRNITLWADSEYAWYDHDDEGRMMSTKRFTPYWRWCKRNFGVDCQDKLLEYSFGSSRPKRSDLIDAYRRHVEEVRKTIPPGQLLEMDISAGDGYEKLAPFLGSKPPRRGHYEMAFPHDCNGHCIHTGTISLSTASQSVQPLPAPVRRLRQAAEFLSVDDSVESIEGGRLCRCDETGAMLPASSEEVPDVKW